MNFNYIPSINLRYYIYHFIRSNTFIGSFFFSEANYYPNRRMEIITEERKSGGKREWKRGEASLKNY